MFPDKLYYWLYAFLNKIYGRTLIFTRDSLHSRYSVNRHSFHVTTNDKSFLLNPVFEKMIQIISNSYPVREKKPNYVSFEVAINKKKFYINISFHKSTNYLGKNFPEHIEVMIF